MSAETNSTYTGHCAIDPSNQKLYDAWHKKWRNLNCLSSLLTSLPLMTIGFYIWFNPKFKDHPYPFFALICLMEALTFQAYAFEFLLYEVEFWKLATNIKYYPHVSWLFVAMQAIVDGA